MSNSKNSDRSSWVVQREYQDAQGIVQTEYRDSLGNIHVEAKDPHRQARSYQSGYGDGVVMEKNSQHGQLKQEEITDRKVSRGLLVSLIIAGVLGLTGALAYYLFELNDTDPVTVVTTPIYKNDPSPNDSPSVVEKNSVTNITPAQPAEPKPQDVNVTIVNESKKDPSPAAPKAQPKPAQPSKTANAPAETTPAAVSAPTSPQEKPIASMAPVPPPSNANNGDDPSLIKTDSQLKDEIVQEFNQQFSSNQLSVAVNQGNVKVSGTVANQKQLDEIEPLLRSMEGVKTIDVKVTSNMSAN